MGRTLCMVTLVVGVDRLHGERQGPGTAGCRGPGWNGSPRSARRTAPRPGCEPRWVVASGSWALATVFTKSAIHEPQWSSKPLNGLGWGGIMALEQVR